MPEQPNPNPKERLVKVFDAEQESEALVVRGLLESNGIESLTRPNDLEQDLFPVGGVAIMVREEQAEEAKQVIEAFRQEGTASEGEEVSEEAAPE
ncbi:MAG: putative signal transducing protein [Chlamydiota bacterium]